ncbi:MAG TPA: DUF6331 family protein [Verrucomicrobiae bacterium]
MNANDTKLILTPLLWEFMHAHEGYCVAGCCGADAFVIKAEGMKHWVRTHGNEVCEQVLKELGELIHSVSEIKNGKIVSEWEQINAVWEPEECVNWLRSWETELKLVLQMSPEELAWTDPNFYGG